MKTIIFILICFFLGKSQYMPPFPSTDKFIPLGLNGDIRTFDYDQEQAGSVLYFSENNAQEGTLYSYILIDYSDYQVNYGGTCIPNCEEGAFCGTYTDRKIYWFSVQDNCTLYIAPVCVINFQVEESNQEQYIDDDSTMFSLWKAGMPKRIKVTSNKRMFIDVEQTSSISSVIFSKKSNETSCNVDLSTTTVNQCWAWEKAGQSETDYFIQLGTTDNENEFSIDFYLQAEKQTDMIYLNVILYDLKPNELTCPYGMFLHQNNFDYYCKDCECSYCDQCISSDKCFKCQSGYSLSDDQKSCNQCYSQVPTYYNLTTFQCESCEDVNCLSCYGKYKCNICEDGYEIFTEGEKIICIPTCNYGQYYSMKQTQCLEKPTCLSNYYFVVTEENCILFEEICKSQEYFSENDQICKPCIANCERCYNSLNCNKCLVGYQNQKRTCQLYGQILISYFSALFLLFLLLQQHFI